MLAVRRACHRLARTMRLNMHNPAQFDAMLTQYDTELAKLDDIEQRYFDA